MKELYCGAEPISADTLARFEQMTAPVGFDAQSADSLLWDGRDDAVRRREARRSRYRTDRSPEPSGMDRVVVSCGEVDSEHTVRIVDPTTLRSRG